MIQLHSRVCHIRELVFTSDEKHPGGGGTLIFSHIRRLGTFFGFKILNFNIFWGLQKNEYFLGV